MAAFKVGLNLRVLIGSISYGVVCGHYGLKGIENLVLIVHIVRFCFNFKAGDDERQRLQALYVVFV